MDATAANRALMTRFCDLFYRQGKTREAFETCVADHYVQHNPHAGNGRDAAITMLEGLKTLYPDLNCTVKRIAVDGDLAFVHSHFRIEADDAGMAVVDIFRMADGLIAEHWDVVQPIPPESANDNSMF